MAKISEYLKVSEAAERRGASRDSPRHWDAPGKLGPRHHPVGICRLGLESDADEWPARLDRSTATCPFVN